MISLDKAALGFAAAGSGARLQVLRLLVKAGHDGLSVGGLQEKLALPASTLAHHLKTLSGAGLIQQVKAGRTVINRADFIHIEQLAAFLLHECCVDADTVRQSSAAAQMENAS